MKTLLIPVCFLAAYCAAILALVLLISHAPRQISGAQARCLAAVEMGFPADLWGLREVNGATFLEDQE